MGKNNDSLGGALDALGEMFFELEEPIKEIVNGIGNSGDERESIRKPKQRVGNTFVADAKEKGPKKQRGTSGSSGSESDESKPDESDDAKPDESKSDDK